MRDIRKDLKERLEHIELRKQRHEAALQMLENKANNIRELLKLEESEWGIRQPTLLEESDFRPKKGKSELIAFILNVLADGNPHRLEEIYTHAKNQSIPIKAKHPRRGIHFALVGLKNRKQVDLIESGVWKLHKNGSIESDPELKVEDTATMASQ